MPGLLATLGLAPLHRTTGQLSADLYAALSSLRGSCESAHPDTALGNTPALLRRAEALEQQLDADEHEATQDEVLAVAQMRGELLAANARVIEAHKAAVMPGLQAALQRCRQAAQQAGVEIEEERWQAVEDGIRIFAALQVVATPRVAHAALDPLLAEVELGRGIADTAGQRVPLRPQDLAQHEGVVPAETLKALIGRMQPGNVSAEPGPLGSADPKYDRGGYPVVEVAGSDGAFRLKPTQATDAARYTCRIQPIGEQLLGRIDTVDEGGSRVNVLAPDGNGFSYPLDAVSRGWVGKLFKRGLTPEAYREVEKRELEHLVDYAYAFRITAGVLARVVNEVAAIEFKTARGPVCELVERLSAGPTAALIPADPFDPEAWADRMTLVLMQLSGYSDKRDKPPANTHCPIGMTTEVAGDSVVIRPVFGTASLNTADIIRLELIDEVFGGSLDEEDEDVPTATPTEASPQAAAWTLRTDLAKGATVKMVRKAAPDVFGAIGGEVEDGGALDPGAEITLEEDPPTAEGTPGTAEVWASASLAALQLNYATSAGDIGYFRVPLEAFA